MSARTWPKIVLILLISTDLHALLPPSPQPSWLSLPLPSWLQSRLLSNEKTPHPLPIQSLALPLLLPLSNITASSQSLIINSPTSSGKTLAYTLPLLAHIDPSIRNSVQAIIIVPSRELGLQVSRVVKSLAAAYPFQGGRKMLTMSILNGSNLSRQKCWSREEPPDIVIGEVGKVLEFVEGGYIKTNNLKFLVVDEVDELFDLNLGGASNEGIRRLLGQVLSPTFATSSTNEMNGFESATSANLSKSDFSRSSRGRGRIKGTFSIGRPVMVFASATIPQRRHFIKRCKEMKWVEEDFNLISLEDDEGDGFDTGGVIPPQIDHIYFVISSPEKLLPSFRKILRRLLLLSAKPKKMLVFLKEDRPIAKIGEVLRKDFLDEAEVFVLDGSLSDRAAAVQMFEDSSHGKRLLLATPRLAARGLDLKGVTDVVNFDLPQGAVEYIHRAGRTGRNMQKGKVVSIVSEKEEFRITRLANECRCSIVCKGRARSKRK